MVRKGNKANICCYSHSMLSELCHYIGVGRFRILGGPRFTILGGGPNSQQAHDVVTTLMRRNDVISTSCAHKIFNKSVPDNYISHLQI